jgi:hypothetical protein
VKHKHNRKAHEVVCLHIADGSAEVAVLVPNGVLCDRCVVHPWDLGVEDLASV